MKNRGNYGRGEKDNGIGDGGKRGSWEKVVLIMAGGGKIEEGGKEKGV